MRTDKNKALGLRKLGKSYNEIKASLGVPKSTLSEWLKSSTWSNKVKKDLTEKAKRNHTVQLRRLGAIRNAHLAKLYRQARHEAKEEFEYFKFHPLFISGVALYWGEGAKTARGILRIGNTDPGMILLFVKFLEKICGIPKKEIKAHILLYPDLDAENCKNFWSQKSSLPIKNFNKCVTIHGRHKTRRLPYGVCYITVCSTYLTEKMNVWLTILPKELIKESIVRG